MSLVVMRGQIIVGDYSTLWLMYILFRFITIQCLQHQAHKPNTEILHYIYKMYLTAVSRCCTGKSSGFCEPYTYQAVFLCSFNDAGEFLKNL